MFRKVRLSHVFAVLFAFLLFAIAGSSTSAQDTGGTSVGAGLEQSQAALAAPVPGGPGFAAVSTFDFIAWDPTSQPTHYFQMVYFNATAGEWATFSGPVELPNHVTVNRLVFYLYDNGASDPYVYLLRCPLDDYGCYIMAQLSSSGAADGIRVFQTTSIATPVIDLQANSYHIEVHMPATNIYRFSGARVDYANTAYLPAIQR